MHPAPTLEDYLEQVAAKTAAPGGGSVAGVTAGLAAALTEMAARYAGEEEAVERAGRLRSRFLDLAREDAEAYTAVLGSRGAEREQALSRASDVPLELAEGAAELAALAGLLAERGSPALRGDALAAQALAEAALRIGATLVLLNLEERKDDPRVARARELRG